MLAGVEVGIDDPEPAHQIDVALQRVEVHQPVGVPVEVVPGEDPALEPGRRLLEEAGKDVDRLGPVGGRYQRTARSESSRRSTIAARFLPMKPSRAVQNDSSDVPMASRWVNSTRALACSSGSNTNGVVDTIMSALPTVSGESSWSRPR